MDLYWLNTSGDFDWGNTSNWNTAADGSGDAPTDAPWINGAYVDSNLHDATNYTTAAYNSSYISGNAICNVIIENHGTINSGTYTIDVYNYSVINGGTFSILVNIGNTNAIINYAVVTGYIENPVLRTIIDGVFNCAVYNDGNIYGGTFSIDSFDYNSGFIDFPNIQTTSGGNPYTGDALLQSWVNGSWAGQLPFPTGADLYYTNAGGDGEWSNTSNWNTDPSGVGYFPTEVPWTNTDGSTNTSNLYDATGGDYIDIHTTIDQSVSGICDIAHIYNNGHIYGGTFTADDFYCNNSVYGGTFTGDRFYIDVCGISGGTFSGNDCINNNGSVDGGTWTGSGFNNRSGISGGIFTGINFTNNAVSAYQFQHIYGGTFEITGFTNNGIIDFPNIQTTSGGDPYTGNWLGQVWDNGSWVSVVPVVPIGDLYYTNASEDGTWETLTNWNTAADGSGVNPTEIPWSNTDGSTNASNLYDATGGAGITISNHDTIIYGNGSDISTCYIDYVSNYGQIGIGIWTGANITNYLYFENVTITGDNFLNLNEIGYGTFTGNNMTNNGQIDASGGVSCSGDNFVNTGLIFGGTFSNNGFTNQYGFLLNATFTGTNFDNSYGIVANCDIRGGFNNVPNGFDPNDYSYSPTFSQIGQVFYTYFSGPSTGTTAGPLGPYYVYADLIGAIKYPTPTGGGGGGIDISRLLGLPFFIKI